MDKLGKFALMANLTPNKGMKKMGAMANQAMDWQDIGQRIREEKMMVESTREQAQRYADNLGKTPLTPTINKIDEMLNGIYPNGVDPSIREFYINLMGKYGR